MYLGSLLNRLLCIHYKSLINELSCEMIPFHSCSFAKFRYSWFNLDIYLCDQTFEKLKDIIARKMIDIASFVKPQKSLSINFNIFYIYTASPSEVKVVNYK